MWDKKYNNKVIRKAMKNGWKQGSKNMNDSLTNDKYLKIYSYKKWCVFFLFYCFGKQDIEEIKNTVDKWRYGIKRKQHKRPIIRNDK